jgi:hypothetical protein
MLFIPGVVRFMMKKQALLAFVICAAVFGMMFAGAVPGHAAGMSVGVNTWYSTWKMDPSQGMEYDPSLMYGPILGLDWGKKWSVTSVLLTGQYKMSRDVLVVPPSTYMTFNFYMRRYDSDTTLNYSVFKWLKIFGGLKYMRYDSHDAVDQKVPIFGETESKHYSYGPGLGIGLTLPVTDSLFALINVSGMYLTGKQTGSGAYDLTETGINATASLAYYVASISTTLALGGRYQYFKSEPDMAGQKTTDLSFYGITFSAIYHFGLGGEE